MLRLSKAIRNKGGFTLVEVLLGAVILIIVLLGTFSMIMNAARYSIQARRQALANNLAQERMERIRNVPFVDLLDPAKPWNDNDLNKRNPIPGTDLTMNTYITGNEEQIQITVSIYRQEDPLGNPEMTISQTMVQTSADALPCTISGIVSNSVPGTNIPGYPVGPVPNATVTAGGQTVTSGTDGRYTISNIPYPGKGNDTIPITATATHFVDYSATVTIASGQTVTHDIGMTPLGGIRGYVKDSVTFSPLKAKVMGKFYYPTG